MIAGSIDISQETARPAAIEEPLNRFFIHRVAHALLPAAITSGVAPNVISVAGIGFGLAAAAAYQNYEDWRFVLAGFTAMLGWHVLDGLDGMVARATGRTSAFGRFLDGACDYTVFILVYVSLSLAAYPVIGALAWAFSVSAGAAHIVQAAWYEAQREAYLRRIKGEPPRPQRTSAAGMLEHWYNALQWRLTAGGRVVDERAACDSGFRERYRISLQPFIRRAGLLAPTARTVGIAAACLAGSPVYYWLWEIAGLTCAGLIFEYRRRAAEAVLISAEPRDLDVEPHK